MSRPRLRAIHVVLLGIAICAVPLIGCDSHSPIAGVQQPVFDKDAESVRFVRSMRESLAQKRRPSGPDVQRLKSIANEYPDEPYIGELLVAILPALKDWDGLVDYYERKSKLTDTDRPLLARVHIKQGDYAGARDVIRPLADAQPTHTEANALMGRALYFFGEYAGAKRYYDRVWDSMIAERRMGDITYRAMIEFDQGDPQRALEFLRMGLELSPDAIGVHNALGRVLAAEGQVKEAEVHRDRASELQDELSRVETGQMLRAARVFALNRALQSGDSDRCQQMIFSYLPDSDAEFQEQLYRFLESMYRVAGRTEEIPALLQRARQVARQGQ